MSPPSFLAKGNIYPDNELTPQETHDYLKKSFMHAARNSAHHKVAQDVFKENWDFARYLSCAVDQQITDVINFSEVTWLFVMFVFFFHGLCGRFINYSDIWKSLGWTSGVDGAIHSIDTQLAFFCFLALAASWLISRR